MFVVVTANIRLMRIPESDLDNGIGSKVEECWLIELDTRPKRNPKASTRLSRDLFNE